VARKPTDEVQLKLRFDERLRRLIAKEAKRNDRSMNSEIVDRLDKSFLHGNLVALMREHIDIASTAAATKTAEQVVQQLRQQNRGSDNDKAS
jgi:hypothetical protein